MISWFASRMAHTDKGVVRYGDLDAGDCKLGRMARLLTAST